MNPHFFGNSDEPLFGVYHPARARGERRPAVLLCPPIGHEYIRTHWTMRMLAAKLARQGHNVLRFDYRGMGDSGGSVEAVDSMATWVEDVKMAADDLMDESATQDLVLVGLRFGASLASLAVADGLPASKLVLWEPVCSGEQYLADLRMMHATMLDLWVCPMTTASDDLCEEMLGTIYSRRALDEIQQFDLCEVADRINLRPMIVRGKGPMQALPDASVVTHDGAWDWADLGSIETAWLPTDAPQLIIEAVSATQGGVGRARSGIAASMTAATTLINMGMPQ